MIPMAVGQKDRAFGVTPSSVSFAATVAAPSPGSMVQSFFFLRLNHQIARRSGLAPDGAPPASFSLLHSSYAPFLSARTSLDINERLSTCRILAMMELSSSLLCTSKLIVMVAFPCLLVRELTPVRSIFISVRILEYIHQHAGTVVDIDLDLCRESLVGICPPLLPATLHRSGGLSPPRSG